MAAGDPDRPAGARRYYKTGGGGMIPADLRILQARDLFVAQAC